MEQVSPSGGRYFCSGRTVPGHFVRAVCPSIAPCWRRLRPGGLTSVLICRPERSEGSALFPCSFHWLTGASDDGVGDPLQPPRPKMQFALCLGVRHASHLSPVVNRIRAKRIQSVLHRDLRWRWRLQPMRKRREPLAHREWLIIRNQINPGMAMLGCRNGGTRRVLNMQPRPDALAISDDRELLLPDLSGNIAIGIEPGAGSIEEATTQDDPFYLGISCRGRLHVKLPALLHSIARIARSQRTPSHA